MPYKDPLLKSVWERKHRPQRLARRRELRRIEKDRIEAQTDALKGETYELPLLLPLVAGGALAAYDPRLALGAGGVTLFIAAVYKKSWKWWLIGVLLLMIAFLFANIKREDPNA